MNAALIADTVERLARDIETLRSEVSHADGIYQAKAPDDAGITGMLQGLRERLGGVEKTLAEIREDVAITAHVDLTAIGIRSTGGFSHRTFSARGLFEGACRIC